ncbi:hypothetical protein BN1708_001578 [Verticillium longisporum]|uniref:Uncharacterized protein n=1 Tax=Verticillium longisporum TaxID=100787 RepID=A0A0G4MZ78_VERLO|nr:hypothetical protein BN1708_001578 [Verticillium longisporum]
MVRGNFWPFTGARSPSRQLPNAIRVRAIPVATSQETWETPREYRGGAAERPRNPRGHSFLFVSGYRINYSRPSRTFAVVDKSAFSGTSFTSGSSRVRVGAVLTAKSSHKDAKRPSKCDIFTRHVRSGGA